MLNFLKEKKKEKNKVIMMIVPCIWGRLVLKMIPSLFYYKWFCYFHTY